MKKFICCLLIVILSLMSVGCSNTAATDKESSKQEVTINLPTDDTVNGYRIDKSRNSSLPDVIDSGEVSAGEVKPIKEVEDGKTASYCGNKNSHVFHKISCSSVSKMKEENKLSSSDRNYFVQNGYKPCARCTP